MPFVFPTPDASEHLATLRRLTASRWVVLAGMALIVMIVPGSLDLALPQRPLLGILLLGAACNAVLQWQLRTADQASAGELFSQLLVDMAILGALLFFSGGATNPLVTLLLPSVAIAALSLPWRPVAGLGLIAVTLYSALLVYYIPLAIPDAARATQWHLIGMWLTFSVSALMIAWFVLRMTGLIRQRDAALAAIREQALRDERIMALGTLAAGAAHELGTPLATMALITGELSRASDLPTALRDDIEMLRQQIGTCKEIITRLSRRAGAERLENARRLPVDLWLDQLRQHWHASRPQASSTLRSLGTSPPPEIVADPRLEQAVLNLLNNAANACPAPLAIRLDWSADRLSIDIADQGPGFPEHVLRLAGASSFAPHAGGSGIGLMLTSAALRQLGGELRLSNPPGGGALARIELPRNDG